MTNQLGPSLHRMVFIIKILGMGTQGDIFDHVIRQNRAGPAAESREPVLRIEGVSREDHRSVEEE